MPSLNERIGILVSTVYHGITIHKDKIQGSTALILVMGGEAVAADSCEVSDYVMAIENGQVF